MVRELAIFTISSDPYLAGTETLLHSFMRHNPWFDGTIFILLETPSRRFIERLTIFPNVKYIYPSKQIKEKMKFLSASLPKFTPHMFYFYNFELFKIRNFSKIVYLDSDIVCQNDVSELFSLTCEIGACGDRAYYDPALARSRDDFSMIKIDDLDQPVLDFPFNAGVVVVDGSLLNDRVYFDLLDLLTPETFRNKPMRLANQIILNLYFEHRVHDITAKYNYNTTLDENWIIAKDCLTPADAVLVHYAGGTKPWHLLQAAPGEQLRLGGLWLKAYRRYLLFRTVRRWELSSLVKWCQLSV